MSRGRLFGTDLESPYHGVRTVKGGTWDAATAYAPRLLSRQFFSHLTAARVHGFALPARLYSVAVLHVTAIRPQREPRTAGVIGHRCDPGRVALVAIKGLVVSSPADTWCQLAELGGEHRLRPDELVVVGDGLVRRKQPLATLAELTDAVARRAGARGSRALREALEQVRPGTDSPKETELRLKIIRAGLPEPDVNVPIFDDAGDFLALGDLVYRLYRILVEYDGEHHFASPEQLRHDVDRLERVMAAGWRVIRVHKDHLRDPRSPHLTIIRSALLHAGWRP